jgi:hypothetical protein
MSSAGRHRRSIRIPAAGDNPHPIAVAFIMTASL